MAIKLFCQKIIINITKKERQHREARTNYERY